LSAARAPGRTRASALARRSSAYRRAMSPHDHSLSATCLCAASLCAAPHARVPQRPPNGTHVALRATRGAAFDDVAPLALPFLATNAAEHFSISVRPAWGPILPDNHANSSIYAFVSMPVVVFSRSPTAGPFRPFLHSYWRWAPCCSRAGAP
jgi:hypothetical protein